MNLWLRLLSEGLRRRLVLTILALVEVAGNTSTAVEEPTNSLAGGLQSGFYAFETCIISYNY